MPSRPPDPRPSDRSERWHEGRPIRQPLCGSDLYALAERTSINAHPGTSPESQRRAASFNVRSIARRSAIFAFTSAKMGRREIAHVGASGFAINLGQPEQDPHLVECEAEFTDATDEQEPPRVGSVITAIPPAPIRHRQQSDVLITTESSRCLRLCGTAGKAFAGMVSSAS
jgi:hypothetical protein